MENEADKARSEPLVETAPESSKPEPEVAKPASAPSLRRSRPFKLLLLAVGLGLAFYLGRSSPHEQHVRVVLGSAAPQVTRVGIQYVQADGEIARETTMTYAPGAAPRVVSHEPSLPDGEYRLRIDLDTTGARSAAHAEQDGGVGVNAPEGDTRRSVESRVTLGGGSTQVDVTSALAPKP